MFVPPTHTLFYSIEKAIKTYRKFAQNRLNEVVTDITLDQALLLLLIDEEPMLSQALMAEQLFKDDASMTRMITLLVKHGFLARKLHPADRRRSLLCITLKGADTLKKIRPVVADNRKFALQGLSEETQLHLKALLRQLTDNCEEAMRDTRANNTFI